MTPHDRTRCGLLAGHDNIKLTDDLAAEPNAELLGFSTHARPGTDGFHYYDAATHGCVLCALRAFRAAHPRKRRAWAVYVETSGAHRMFSRRVLIYGARL